jgi:hypothetical protein
MTEQEVKNFLKKHGAGVDDRVNIPYGGIYLWRFLLIFRDEVKKEVTEELLDSLKDTSVHEFYNKQNGRTTR